MAIPRNPKPQPQAQSTEATPAAAPLRPRAPIPARANTNTTHAHGFVKSTAKLARRLIISATGEDHSGKNHFAFTAPAPIYVHSFDPGIEGVIEKFNQKKDIYVATYELEVQPGEGTAQAVAESADKLWADFVSNFRDGLASCGQGTTVLDTDTEVWELLRLARFGKLTQIMPHMYGPVNAEMRDLLHEPWGKPVNVFFLSKYVDEWENYTDATGKERGRKTGNKVQKGFSDLAFHVQVCGVNYREDREGGGSDFRFLITDCRQAPECNGMVIANDYDELLLNVLGPE